MLALMLRHGFPDDPSVTQLSDVGTAHGGHRTGAFSPSLFPLNRSCLRFVRVIMIAPLAAGLSNQSFGNMARCRPGHLLTNSDTTSARQSRPAQACPSEVAQYSDTLTRNGLKTDAQLRAQRRLQGRHDRLSRALVTLDR